MPEVWKWSATRTATEVAGRSISAREVVESHLARLDAVNPELNAVTNDVREYAIADAAALDEELAAGTRRGPLHGVPVTIKENIDVAGQVTPNGLESQRDLVAPSDSPLVSHLRAAGAVIVGRTNTPEMSYRWHTVNPLRGETKNPWSPNRTPGGSSGGAGASVVAGIGTIAHGNDLGGSIRQPANCCGLASIRPSLGRIAAHNASAVSDGTMALQLMSVQGPLAREVADVRLALEVMTQPSPRDPWYRQVPLAGPPIDGAVRVAASYGLPGAPTDPDVKTAIDDAAAHLTDAGYAVEFIEPPDLEAIRLGWQAILATETKVTVYDDVYAQASADFRDCLDWMFVDDVILDLAGLVRAYAERSTILRRWTEFLADHPVVLMPVSQLVPFAPNDDASSGARFNEILVGHTPLVAINYLGLPAATVAVTETADGPIGVQLVGGPFREDLCLDAAAAIESRVGIMAEQLWNR